MRLAKYIAQAGIASRRKAEQLIIAGKVEVNGVTIKIVATNVDSDKDSITYQGKKITAEKYVYYILHKPIGYVCSLKDKHNSKLVTDLVPRTPRVYPVGRLDKDSSGLIIMTNDGSVTQQLSHPRYQHSKVYLVEVVGPNLAIDKLIERLRKGVRLSEGRATFDSIKKISSTHIQVSLHQGWKRQIRRMVAHCGATVVSLQRIAEGRARLGNLEAGAYKAVDRDAII